MNPKIREDFLDVAPSQAALDRTVGSNDNATGTVQDTGSNINVPVSVTTTAALASDTQTPAGTRSLRAQISILINNIAHLFANKENTIATGTTSQY